MRTTKPGMLVLQKRLNISTLHHIKHACLKKTNVIYVGLFGATGVAFMKESWMALYHKLLTCREAGQTSPHPMAVSLNRDFFVWASS